MLFRHIAEKPLHQDLRLAGSGGTTHWFPRTIRFLSQIKDKYDFAALNSHHYKFEELEAAMDLACNHKDIAHKVMLTFDE